MRHHASQTAAPQSLRLYKEGHDPEATEARRRKRAGWIVAIIIALTIWGLTDVRRRAREDVHNPSVHRTDLTVYTEAGEAFFDGRDPYKVTNPRGWHYLYPPLFAIAMAPLSLLDSQHQALVWFFISVLACWGCILECDRIGRMLGLLEESSGRIFQAIPNWFLIGVASAMLVPFLNCLQRGQVGAVVLYFLLLGFRLTMNSKNWKQAAIGGVVLALPVAIKLTPALPVLVLMASLTGLAWFQASSPHAIERAVGAWRGVIGGGFLFLVLLPSIAVGPIDNLIFLDTWVDRVVLNDDLGDENDFNERSKRNQSMENAVERFGNWIAFTAMSGPDDRLVEDLDNVNVAMPMESRTVGLGLNLMRLFLIGSLFVAGWRAARNHDHAAVLTVFAMACPLTLLVSPLSWVHHYMIWLPALVLLPRLQWYRQAPRTAMAMVLVPAALVWAHYLAMDLTGRLGLLGLGTTVWFAMGTFWLFRNIEPRVAQLELDQPNASASTSQTASRLSAAA